MEAATAAPNSGWSSAASGALTSSPARGSSDGANATGVGHEEPTALYIALFGVVQPLISLVGVVTNLANAVVLAHLIKRKRTPVYDILLAMAVADFFIMGVLLVYGLRFYSRAYPMAHKDDVENIDEPSYFFFHTWPVFANVCGMASNWCTVAMTAFRFLAVYFPLRAPVLCTRRRAQIVIAFVYVASVIVNIPWALVNEYRLSTGRFVLREELDDRYKLTYYVALLVLYHVLPWIVSAALVVLLLLGLWSQHRLVRADSMQEKHKNVEQMKLSLTVTSVAAWFIVSTAPKVVYHLIEYTSPRGFSDSMSGQCFFAVTQTLVAMNYAANFFMYAFISHTYRTQLVSIVCCQETPRTVTTDQPKAISAVTKR